MTINILELAINFFEGLLETGFMSLYMGCKYEGVKKWIPFFAETLVYFALITLFNSLYVYEGILVLIFTLMNFLYAVVFLKGNLSLKLFVAGFSHCALCAVAEIVILSSSFLFSMNIGEILRFSIQRVLMICVSKLLLITIYCFVLKYKIKYISSGKYAISIFPIVAQLVIVGETQTFNSDTQMNRSMLLIAVGILILIILAYYMFIKMSYEHEMKNEYEQLLKQYQQQETYVEDMKALQENVYAARHDLLHYFDTILALSGNEEKIKNYIVGITNERLDIENELIKSDNECFNAIMSAKLARCTREKIKFKCILMNHALDKFTGNEISTLFGNLMDNAIRAAAESEAKEINLDVRLAKNGCFIRITNSIAAPVLENNRALKTTKGDKKLHGYGIKNIKSLIKELGGSIVFSENQSEFICEIYV